MHCSLNLLQGLLFYASSYLEKTKKAKEDPISKILSKTKNEIKLWFT